MSKRVTKIDKLFALKAVENEVTKQRKDLEYECRDELLEDYMTDGTDRRTSPFFGPDAGKFSVKRTKGTPDREVPEYTLDDDESFLSWVDDNASELGSYILSRWHDFSSWWFAETGELPDGVTRRMVVEHGKPEQLSAQIYSLNTEVIFGKLGDNILEGANSLLLGEGDTNV